MLKRNITIALLLLNISYGFSQTYAWNPRENQFEIQKQAITRYDEPRLVSFPFLKQDTKVPGTNMRRVGRILTCSGAALIVAGIAMLSSADSDNYQYSNTYGSNGHQEQGDPMAAFGATFAVMGTGATVTGIILWTKGASKMRKYKHESEMEIK